MGLRAYPVRKTIGDEVFDFYHPEDWFYRLLELNKFENGASMEISADEIAEMERAGDLTPAEQEIVDRLKVLIAENGGEPLYLEYF